MEKACDFAGCSHVGTPATCSLNKLGVGCCGKVVEVGGSVRGYCLSLRDEQAAYVKIVPLTTSDS